MIDILRFQDPLKVEAGAGRILILNPPTLLQGFLNVRLATCADEYLRLIIHFEFLFLGHQVCDVSKDNLLWLVALQELI